jgi:hypothetical protein
MPLDESVPGMHLGVIERAQAPGNVSAVCRELVISRTVLHRWRSQLERYGVDGVHPRQRARAGRPVATQLEVECPAPPRAIASGVAPRPRLGRGGSAVIPFTTTRAGETVNTIPSLDTLI